MKLGPKPGAAKEGLRGTPDSLSQKTGTGVELGKLGREDGTMTGTVDLADMQQGSTSLAAYLIGRAYSTLQHTHTLTR